MLAFVGRDAPTGGLPAQYEEGLRTALDYFRDAAPLHTQDEEDSLFPRLGRSQEAATIIVRLEAEHSLTEPYHAEIEELGRAWLSHGDLSSQCRDRFAECVDILLAVYQEHIRVEDEELFPLAATILKPDEVEAIGEEMASRRGLVKGEGK